MATKQPKSRLETHRTEEQQTAQEVEYALKKTLYATFIQMREYRLEEGNRMLYNAQHDRYVRLANELRAHMAEHGEQISNLKTYLVGVVEGEARLIEKGVKEPPGLDYVQ